MDIYTDLSIFGIRIYNISYDDDIYNLFQRKYDVIMSYEKKKKLIYFTKNYMINRIYSFKFILNLVARMMKMYL